MAAFSSSSWRSLISSRNTEPIRSAAFALIAAAGLSLGAGTPAIARADGADAGVPARADSTSSRSAPYKVMLRSAVVPGWGQMYNHQFLKAALVAAGEGFIVYKALDELRLENDAIDRAGTLPEGPEQDLVEEERLAHQNRKINWIWWGVAAHLLSMADAYVDAHLSTFEDDFGPPEGALRRGGVPEIRLAYRVRF